MKVDMILKQRNQNKPIIVIALKTIPIKKSEKETGVIKIRERIENHQTMEVNKNTKNLRRIVVTWTLVKTIS